MKSAKDWNVVVTSYDGEFAEATRLLRPFGEVSRTDYWNVLTLLVEDIPAFLDAVCNTVEVDASIPNSISRIVPVTRRFQFQSPAQFESGARGIVDEWVGSLAGQSFHVRMHRRGFKGRISSQHEERFLDHHVLERLRSEGRGGRIDFDDPDVIIAVETIGQGAGLSKWTRDERESFGFLRLN